MSLSKEQRIKKQLIIMLAIVAGMFVFCFALIPFYNVFCKVTGLNGKTAGQVVKLNGQVDLSRTVTVELTSTLNESMPTLFQADHFQAKDKKLTLHPGEYVTTSFKVKNVMPHPVVVQAIPSVTPGLGARHIQKIECFCFQRQPLEALEEKEMPLVFTVDPAIPTHIHTLTLAYTLFDITEPQQESKQ